MFFFRQDKQDKNPLNLVNPVKKEKTTIKSLFKKQSFTL